jgi:hypothetical protein
MAKSATCCSVAAFEIADWFLPEAREHVPQEGKFMKLLLLFARRV